MKLLENLPTENRISQRTEFSLKFDLQGIIFDLVTLSMRERESEISCQN